MIPADRLAPASEGMEMRLQLKADFAAAGHRQALRQRVSRCWDLLQQQHQQCGLAGRDNEKMLRAGYRE